MSSGRTAAGGARRQNPQASIGRLRPRERVLQYLRAEFERPDIKEGSRLPSMKDLSGRLQVSIATVQGVYRKLAAEGRVRTHVGNGSFLIAPRTRTTSQLTIALSIRVPSDSPAESWFYRIYGGMLKATLHSARPIVLRPLPETRDLGEAARQQLLEERGSADGLILVPLLARDPVRLAYEQAGKPVVDLNPPSENATANFVSPDYFGASCSLAAAWKETGRKRVVMIGPSQAVSVSTRLRHLGMLAVLGSELGRTVSYQFVEGGDDGYEPMSRLLRDRESIPDAVFCTGDFLALGALRAVREAGLRVPRDVSVVGGTNADLSETICPQLTRTKQPLERMGEELIAMLCRRIELLSQGESSVPGKYLPLPYTGGATTRAEENAILGITSPTPQ